MHEIGAACGVSGPAIYRHFASKDDMLAQMLVEISERLLAEAHRRADAADGHLHVLRALVGWHIEFALEYPSLIVVQEREWASLRPEARDAVRSLQLAYIDRWVQTVRTLRPDLDAAAGRARVQAVFGLLNSTPRSARIDQAGMRSMLAPMAEAALLAETGSRAPAET